MQELQFFYIGQKQTFLIQTGPNKFNVIVDSYVVNQYIRKRFHFERFYYPHTQYNKKQLRSISVEVKYLYLIQIKLKPLLQAQNKQLQAKIIMAKHQGPIKRLIDPFSIPAQMNNLCVLIVAYVTFSMNGDTHCTDQKNMSFLYFIWYGSNIVCFGTLMLSIFYMVGIIDFCFNKVIPCGQVCLTLNTLVVFIAGVVYHFIATIYGIWQLLWGSKSTCIQLQMFKRITCFIYLLWFFVIILYVLFNCYRQSLKTNLTRLNTNLIQV